LGKEGSGGRIEALDPMQRSRTKRSGRTRIGGGVLGSHARGFLAGSNLVDEDNVVALCYGELGGVRAEGHARDGVVLWPFGIRLKSGGNLVRTDGRRQRRKAMGERCAAAGEKDPSAD
jgi:hypothetical protein